MIDLGRISEETKGQNSQQDEDGSETRFPE